MRRPFLVFVLFAIAFADARNNNDSPEDQTTGNALDPIIVTATRRSQPASWVSDDHHVINVDRLQLSTSQNISELLGSLVPARISDYGSGGAKTISLRGAGSERTLLLVDGKRIGTSDNDLGDMSVNAIEKIEIIEGGQSALYGMDAIGGVINIITRQIRAERLSGTVSMGLSSFDKGARKNQWNASLNGKKAGLTIGQNNGIFGWMTGLNWNESNGKFDYTDRNGVMQIRENNGFNNLEALQKVTLKRGALTLDALGTYCDRALGSPGKLVAPSRATTKKKIGSISIDGGYALMKIMNVKLNSSLARENINFSDPNPLWPVDSKHIRSHENIECIQEITLNKQMINMGIQALRNEANSTEIGTHAINQWGIFANGIFKESIPFVSFEQTPAIRFDHASTFGNTSNGKIGVIMTGNIPLNPALFFNVGSSFRAPSFDDLYWPRDEYTKGNRYLKPEKSENWDAGFQARHAFYGFAPIGRLSYYKLKLEDMILWAPDVDGLWMPKNISEASIEGYKIDLSLNYRQSWSAAFVYHHSDARDKQSGKRLIYRPRSMLTCSAEHFGKSLNAGISYSYSDTVYTDEANTSSLPYTHLVNIHAGWKIPVRFEGMWLVYDMLNATNQERSTNEGYPLPGREHRLTLKLQF